MAYEVVRGAQKVTDFTPLDEHLEQTPQTFFGAAKPVLHLHCPSATVAISKAELVSRHDFAALQGQGSIASGGDDNAPVPIDDVDAWVTSK